MPQGRHAADGESGMRAHEVGVRPSDRLADERADPPFVDAIGAAGDDEQRPAGLLEPEHERLRNLADVAAHGGRRRGRRRDGVLEDDDRRRDAGGGRRIGDAARAGRKLSHGR